MDPNDFFVHNVLRKYPGSHSRYNTVFSHTGLLIHYSSTYFILFKGSYLKSVYLDR